MAVITPNHSLNRTGKLPRFRRYSGLTIGERSHGQDDATEAGTALKRVLQGHSRKAQSHSRGTGEGRGGCAGCAPVPAIALAQGGARRQVAGGEGQSGDGAGRSPLAGGV